MLYETPMPYETTWLAVKDPVDFAALTDFAMSLCGAVTCAEPPPACARGPEGTAALSYSYPVSKYPEAGPVHESFVAACGRWLTARDLSYAWKYSGGDWQHAGRRT